MNIFQKADLWKRKISEKAENLLSAMPENFNRHSVEFFCYAAARAAAAWDRELSEDEKNLLPEFMQDWAVGDWSPGFWLECNNGSLIAAMTFSNSAAEYNVKALYLYCRSKGEIRFSPLPVYLANCAAVDLQLKKYFNIEV